MIILRPCKLKALLICTATILSFAVLSPTQGVARSRVQDHRNPNIGGQAVLGGPHVKCVLPFCGNSFHPQGRRPQVQDHRPGSNVPPITNGRNPVSGNANNTACLANHTCVPNTQWTPTRGGGHPRPSQPQRPPIVPSH